MNEQYSYTIEGSGPGLLLAHGAGGGIEANFGPLMADLRGTHTVVGPDLPGAGATPRSASPLDLDTVADTLVATAVGAGVERFTVLGYSLGTAVAVRAATRHPDRVEGLGLTAGVGELLDGDRALLARFATLVAVGAPTLEALSAEELTARLRAAEGFVPEGSPEQVDLAASVDTRDDLPRITVPTLVVATTLDRLVPPEASRELAEGIPGAEYAEVGSGHLIADEAPDAWLSLVRDFLDRHDRARV
ncbi:alpha/beta fold hydrolase [Nocardiopsis alba]|uniref:Alpha/beta hydrolase fold family protein n=1 Tax=Nocardiopsis alba (strain ATCC BAA-2165 / BE74) TaxID=1205910 RepID=J7LFM8_NOCAA|nr:alpha/beta fold hydrolase [Nocardiopsis alba]AFR09372.1 alpha/beta hydrolase fold family protein [Nocardiopsis alba ATCC BAA-2165]